MKILFAADEQPYSAYALTEVTRLALNTWADVTLWRCHRPGEKALRPNAGPGPTPGLATLQRYREVFLESGVGEESGPVCPGQLALRVGPPAGRPLGGDAGGQRG